MSQLSLLGSAEALNAALRDLIHDYGYDAVALEVRRLTPTTVAASAPARHSDPDTSQMAAKQERDVGRFSIGSRQARLLIEIAERPGTDQQVTSRVIATNAPPSQFDGARRRMSDLRAVGYICDSGRRRKNPGSDDLAIVWEITEAGSRAKARLIATGWSR